jgi:hypothetical protein
MNNMDIYNTARQCPQDALKPIQAGRLKGKSDINPMWRIKMLTQLFGPVGIGWYYTIDKQWMEACGDEIAAFVNISLYVKVNDEWSKPIQGTGGSMFAAKEKNGVYVSDEAYKMALTDAISVACKALGFAADVYWNTDSTKYNRQAAQPTQQPRAPKAQAQAQPQAQPAPDENAPVTPEQAQAILNECSRRGLNPAAVCAVYSKENKPIAQVTDFNQRQYNHLMANWGKVLEIIGGKAS